MSPRCECQKLHFWLLELGPRALQTGDPTSGNYTKRLTARRKQATSKANHGRALPKVRPSLTSSLNGPPTADKAAPPFPFPSILLARQVRQLALERRPRRRVGPPIPRRRRKALDRRRGLRRRRGRRVERKPFRYGRRVEGKPFRVGRPWWGRERRERERRRDRATRRWGRRRVGWTGRSRRRWQ